MIEIGTFSRGGLKTIGNNPEALSCPLNQAQKYQELRENAEWHVDHELDMERYYLSESDGDTWYSHRDFVRRMAKIKELETRTPQQRERDIHSRIMAEIFPGAQVHELIPGQPVTPKPEVSREAA